MAKNKRQADINQMEADLRNLGEARDLRTKQIEQKEAEQRGYMVAARVRKDASAQGNIDRLSGEIETLQADNLQDYGAAEELREQIKAGRVELEREERRSRYEAILGLLRPRAEGRLERQLFDLAKQMVATANELADSDKKIARELSSFGPEFYSESQNLSYLESQRRNYLSALLCGVVETPIPRSYVKSGSDPARAISRIMLAVEEEAAEIGRDEATVEAPHEAPPENSTTVAWGGEGQAKMADLPKGETTVVG